MIAVRIHPEAEAEAAEAARWYAERSKVLCVAHMKRRALYWIARLADIEDDPEW